MFLLVQVTGRQEGRAAALGEDGGAAVMASGLRKAFGEVVALADLTVTVRYESVVGLLGPNGSGKTTAVSIRYDGQSAPELVQDSWRLSVCVGVRGEPDQQPEATLWLVNGVVDDH
jgi:hypothetical protein